MTPLNTCSCCKHPAIKAAKQCRKAMELVNSSQLDEAESLVRSAMNTLLQAPLPLIQAKLLNSLGLIYIQQQKPGHAKRCFHSSLRIIDKHIGQKNWLYAHIQKNQTNLETHSAFQ